MENRIKEMRLKRGLSMAQLANLIGTTAQQINHLEKGSRRLSDMWMERLSVTFEVQPYEIIADLKTIAGREVPVLGDIPAGGPCDLATYDYNEAEFYIKWADAPIDSISFRIRENSFSMNKMAMPGMYILIDPNQTTAESLHGKYVVVNINGKCMFKRYFHTPIPRLEPHSFVSDYDIIPINKDSNFHIIGRVVSGNSLMN